MVQTASPWPTTRRPQDDLRRLLALRTPQHSWRARRSPRSPARGLARACRAQATTGGRPRLLSITERGTALHDCSIEASPSHPLVQLERPEPSSLRASVIRLNQPWITRLRLTLSKSNAVGALRPEGLDGPTNVKPVSFCYAVRRGVTSVRRRVASLEHRRRERPGSNFARAERSVSNRGLEG